MNKDRLLKLADFLEQEVDSKRFDLEDFATDESFHPLELNDFWTHTPAPVKVGCGTTACAVGWATCVPSFKRAGLRLLCEDPNYAYPAFKDEAGWSAVKAFFDLEWNEAYYLFDPGYYPESHREKSYVVKRIRAFVKRGGLPKRQLAD